ncbi:MAG: amidohydrolase family protein [Acidimicrobiales bacterium]
MAEAAKTTRIRSARWVIAWDGGAGDHRYLNDADVVFRGSEIVHVGAGFEGTVDTDIDGGHVMVMPGLVSTHAHLNSAPFSTGLLEEVLDPMFGHSPMYTKKGPFWVSDVNTPGRDAGQHFVAAMRHSLTELLGSGVTTVVDIQNTSDGDELWCESLSESGIRAYVAPSFQEAQWRTRDGRVLEFEWDAKAGLAGFERANATLDTVDRFGDGRLSGMMFPAQVETVGEGLMRECREEARTRDIIWQTHCAQSVPEFREMVARTGRTSIQWLADIGALDETAVLGHAIYLDHHSSLAWHSRDDLGILAESGAAIAHCPLTFSRWGTVLETFLTYRDAGVRIAMGNDTGPVNMLEEIRCAFTQARVASNEPASISMADVFRAATIGGADALGRTDIGRIATGAKADLVLVDLAHPRMQSCTDPLRALVFVAADRAIRDVYVDGRLVYADGNSTAYDAHAASAALNPAMQIMIDEVNAASTVPDVDDITSLSFSKA